MKARYLLALVPALIAVFIFAPLDADVQDWWWMFRKSNEHLGFTTASAPVTGDLYWSRNLGGDGEVESSPAVVDGRVYVGVWEGGILEGRVYCLDAMADTIIWTFVSGNRVRSSPAVYGGKVYVGSMDHNIYCLPQDDPNEDKIIDSGEVIWSYETDGGVFSSPVVFMDTVCVGSFDNTVYCLDGTNGDSIWTYPTGDNIVSSPAYSGGKIYVGSNDGKVYCIYSATGDTAWTFSTGQAVKSSPAVTGNEVFIGCQNDTLYCLDASSGSVTWAFGAGDDVRSSPAVAYDRIFVGSADSIIYCLPRSDPNGNGIIESSEILWSDTTGGPIYSSPAVADEKVYVGSDDGIIYCLSYLDGSHIWISGGSLNEYMRSSPAVAMGCVYIGSYDGNLYAFGSPTVCEITPDTLDFGQVVEYTILDTTFVITNTGFGVLSGYAYGSSCPYDFYYIDGYIQYDLGPGESDTVTVRFSPTSPDTYSCIMDTGSELCSDVYCTGIGVLPPPVCKISVGLSDIPLDTLDFGTLGVGDYIERSFTIINEGGSELTGDVSASCDYFSIESGWGPYSLDYNEYVVVTVRFEPPAAGTFYCTIETGSAYCGDVYCKGAAAAPDNQWPMFHHDLANTGYSVTDAPDINSILWKLETAAGYVSSPVVYNGRVYAGTDSSFYCLDASDGDSIWTKDNIGGAGPSVSSAFAGGKVYVGSVEKVYCLDASNGDSVWAYTAVSGLEGFYSPTVYDGKVYVGSNQRFYCLDTLDGNDLWIKEIRNTASSPAVVDDKVYVGSLDSVVYCLDASDGDILWTSLQMGEHVFSPAVYNGRVYVGSGDSIMCLDGSNGDLVWSYPTGSAIMRSPAVAYGMVYVASYDFLVHCLDASTGGHVWSYPTGYTVAYYPTVADGKVYVGSEYGFHCLDAANGTSIWDYTTGGYFASSPAVVDSVVYVGSNDGKLYAFGGMPVCDISPVTIDFDTVFTNSYLDTTFTITNTGTGTLIGDVSVIEGGSWEYFEIISGGDNYEIGAGQSDTVTVRYAPGDVGDHNCDIDTGSDLCGDVSCTGVGEEPPPICAISPDTVDFGPVWTNQFADSFFTITNVGGHTLAGNLHEGCQYYNITSGSSYSLTAGQTDSVWVKFFPQAIGEFECEIDTDTPCLNVICLGEGVEPPPVCTVFPDTLDFGTVYIGSFYDSFLTITNDGGGTLTGKVRERHAYYEVISDSVFALTAGNTDSVHVRFEPLAAGTFLHDIDIDSPCSRMTCRGVAIAPPICSITPDTLDIGPVPAGQSADSFFTITNVGGGILTGSLNETCEYFEITSGGSYSLTAGQTDSVWVEFSPMTIEEFECEIDTDVPCLNVICLGDGVEPPPVCTVFPDTIDFGSVYIGSFYDSFLTITNDGGGTLTGSVRERHAYYEVISDSVFALTAGNIDSVHVRFEPLAEGIFLHDIDIDSPCSKMTCRGVAVEPPPECEVIPAYIDFGSWPTGHYFDSTITITNIGGGLLEGTVEEACDQYSIFSGGGPYALNAGEEWEVTIRFAPTMPGPHNGCVVSTGTLCDDLLCDGIGEQPADYKWPMFRCDLHNTGESVTAGPALKYIRWIYDPPEYGSPWESSPAVFDGMVYAGTVNKMFYCLDIQTGDVIWSDDDYVFGSSSPAVADGMVYVGDSYGDVICFDAYGDGYGGSDLIWHFYGTMGDVYSSPAVAYGMVYVGSDDGKVYCMPQDDPNEDGNIENGELIWTYTTGDMVRSSPAVFDGRIYVGSDNGNIYCLDARGNGDGTTDLVWIYSATGAVRSSPAVASGMIYVGSNDNTIYCLDAYGNGDGTTDMIWTYDTGGEVQSSPAVASGMVYVGSNDNTIYCLDAYGNGDGTTDMIWTYETTGDVYSSPALFGGMVAVGSKCDTVYCLDANGNGDGTTDLVWAHDTGNWVESSPAVADGMLFVGSGDKLFAFTGEQICSINRIDIKFGTVPIGGFGEESFRITNVSSGDVLSGTVRRGSEHYIITNGAGQYDLDPDEYHDVTVRFVPTVPGSFNSTIRTGAEQCGDVSCEGEAVMPPGYVWPFFHYDLNNTGYAEVKGPEESCVFWTYSNYSDPVRSSPTIVNGKIYMVSDSTIQCVNAFTGAQIWESEDDDYTPWQSPAVSNNKIYAGAKNHFRCLNASSGTPIWEHTIAGVNTSPAVACSMVFVGSDNGTVYSLDAEGSGGATYEHWSYPTGDTVRSSPTVFDGKVYVGSYNDSVYCFDFSNGMRKWVYPTGGNVHSSPAIYEGKVYIGSDDETVYCLDAGGSGGSTVAIWTFDTQGKVRSSPAVAVDGIYGRVYVGSNDGYIYCLDADGDQGQPVLKWKKLTNGAVYSSPASARDTVYVGSDDNKVYCFTKSGNEVWTYPTGGDVRSSPAIAYDKLYVGSDDGKLYAFRGCPVCEVSGDVIEEMGNKKIDFGTVKVNDEIEKEFYITNTGKDTLKGVVSLPCVPPCTPYEISQGAGSYSLAEGSTHDVVVTFNPGSSGTWRCNLSLGSTYCGTIQCTGIAQPTGGSGAVLCMFNAFGYGSYVEVEWKTEPVIDDAGLLMGGNTGVDIERPKINGGIIQVGEGGLSGTSSGSENSSIKIPGSVDEEAGKKEDGDEAVNILGDGIDDSPSLIGDFFFDIFRSTEVKGEKRKINKELIPIQGDGMSEATYTFIDDDVSAGNTYYYWLGYKDMEGNSVMEGPVWVTLEDDRKEEESLIPASFRLAQNYPNPFNPVTEIAYDLPIDCNVRLEIYNVHGRKVLTLLNEHQKAGRKSVHWDGRSDKGLDVPSGIYFYRLRAGRFTKTRKMVLMR